MPVQPRWLFVKVETDSDLVGYGECLGDKAFVIAEAVRSYERVLQAKINLPVRGS